MDGSSICWRDVRVRRVRLKSIAGGRLMEEVMARKRPP